MKAICKINAGEGLKQIKVEMPDPSTNEVLIKILKTAICGTDLHIYQWNEWAKNTIKPPLIIGHEFVGEIA
nr:alcohol dehydrogenase catalytic domain-containing protein [Candidatus Neomarinimicrobiota bacterium]